jgi:hypothetical protein
MKYENVCITILPDMLFCGLLIEMVIKQSDRIACLPAWAEDGQEVPKNIYLLSFDSSLTARRSNRVVGFVWIWIGIACLPAWAEDGQQVPKNIYL